MNNTQPNQFEIEREIIGIMLDNPSARGDVFDGLDGGMFVSYQYRKIFDAAKALYNKNDTVSAITISEYIAAYEPNNEKPRWLAKELIKCSGERKKFPSDLPGLKARLIDAYYFRKFVDKFGTTVSFDGAVQLANEVLQWASNIKDQHEIHVSEAVKEFLKKQEAINDGTIQVGYSTGLAGLDNYVRFSPGKLYVIGGIKKGGKSLFLLHLLNAALEAKSPTLLMSIEMTAEEIVRRLLSLYTDTNSSILLTPNADVKSIISAAGKVGKLPLFINDNQGINVQGICNTARRWKYRNEIPDGEGMVGVDFLQLIKQEYGQGLSEASLLKNTAYELARLAKELRVAVIALAQLRNEAEGQKPRLGFLEGSGGIAQAAECILLLDLHSRREPDYDSTPPEPIDVIIAAQRTGQSGKKVHLEADLGTMKFTERNSLWEEDDELPI